MSKVGEAKTLGGVGSILALLPFIPVVGWVISIVGLILMLVAIKQISEVYSDPSIFRNMLVSVVIAIVGVVIGLLVIATTLLSLVGLRALSNSIGAAGGALSAIGGVAGALGILLGLGIIWILFVVSAIFVRKSYSEISLRTGVGMFSTSALLYLIGAALTVILVGFILIFIALIMNVVAFFSLSDNPPIPPTATPLTPSPMVST
jgi:uncharacterized membrane protein